MWTQLERMWHAKKNLCVLLPLLLLLDANKSRGALDHQQQSHEWLVGWQGESYRPPQPAEKVPPTQQQEALPQSPAAAHRQLHTIHLSQGLNFDQSWVQVLSWQPRLHLHHNFLSAKECDDLVALRTAHQAGHQVQQVDDQLLYTLEQRIANWTALPPFHIEGWQMQQGFEPSEQAALHMDLLTDRLSTEDFQRKRAATVILFLSDAEADTGSTTGSRGWSLVFPNAAGGSIRKSTQQNQYEKLLLAGQQVQQQLTAAGIAAQGHRRSDTETLKLQSAPSSTELCSGDGSGLRLTGFRKGSALLVWNLLIDGQTPDITAAHVACGAGVGAQGMQPSSAPWIATTWLHNMPIDQDDALGLAAQCTDKNPQCSEWAAKGFCDDAPGLMLGLRGMCRYSCSDCNICKQPLRGDSTASQDTATRAAAPEPGAATFESATMPGHFGHPSEMPASSVKVVHAAAMHDYVECLYQNMHSLRQEWSDKAREAGVRKARNAIRRDMKLQAAAGTGM